jgi:hypothetical protein
MATDRLLYVSKGQWLYEVVINTAPLRFAGLQWNAVRSHGQDQRTRKLGLRTIDNERPTWHTEIEQDYIEVASLIDLVNGGDGIRRFEDSIICSPQETCQTRPSYKTSFRNKNGNLGYRIATHTILALENKKNRSFAIMQRSSL